MRLHPWHPDLNVLFITADQWRGDCLERAGHPVVRTPEPRPARRRRRVVPAPLRPGRAVRAEPGVALHRHVPDEPPVGAQRHAARRPPHNVALDRPRASATSRRCSATPTRASTPARSRPTTRACARYEGVLPGFDPVCHLPEGEPARVARLDARRRASTCPTTGARSSTSPAEGTTWRTQYDAEHTPDRVPHRPAARLRRRPLGAGQAVVRARLVPAAAPAVPRARALRHDVRPRVGARRRCARRRAPRKARSTRCSA